MLPHDRKGFALLTRPVTLTLHLEHFLMMFFLSGPTHPLAWPLQLIMLEQLGTAVLRAEQRKLAFGKRRQKEDYDQGTTFKEIVKVRLPCRRCESLGHRLTPLRACLPPPDCRMPCTSSTSSSGQPA